MRHLIQALRGANNKDSQNSERLWLAPLALATCFLLIFFALLGVLQRNSDRQAQRETLAEAQSVRESLELRIKGNEHYLALLANQRARGSLSQDSFQVRAGTYVSTHPELIDITWVDSNSVIQDVAPRAPNRAILGLTLDLPEPRQASKEAALTHSPRYTHPFEAIQGNTSFEIWVPVFHEKRFLGLFAGVYSVDGLISQVVQPSQRERYHVSILGPDQAVIAETSNRSALAKESPTSRVPLDIPGTDLYVQVTPYKTKALDPVLALFGAFSVATVIGLSFAMWRLRCELLEHSRAEVQLRASQNQHAKALTELKQVEERLARTQELSLVMPLHVGLEGQWLKVPASFCRFLGYSREKLIGGPFRDVTHPDDFWADWSQCLRLLEGEIDSFELEKRFIRNDGSIVWGYINCSIVTDENGKPLHFLTYVRDITKEKQTSLENERLLNEIQFEKNRFEAVIKQMPAGVIIADAPSGKLIFANEQILQVFRHQPHPLQTIEEHFFWTGFHTDGRPYQPEEWPLARSISQGETVTNEDAEIVRGDGTRGIIRLSSSPVRDRAGSIVAAVVICQDVTELKEAIQVRDEFISIASHELKTPITSMKLQAHLLSRSLKRTGTVDPAVLQSSIESTSRQLDRLTALIEDMLDISRISTKRVSLRPETFVAAEMIEDVISRFTPQADAAHLSITTDLDPAITVRWDRFRMEQVLTNLISNALKYGGGKPVHVALASPRQGTVLLSVHDQGIGIPKEHHQRVFNKFERAVQSNHISGLGLGLFITSEIVQLHSGKIAIDSEPGRGATFTLELPAQVPENATNWSPRVGMSN